MECNANKVIGFPLDFEFLGKSHNHKKASHTQMISISHTSIDLVKFSISCIPVRAKNTVYIRAYAEQTVTERTDVYGSTRFFAPKMFFRSFKVTNANIETKLEQMCCIHTRLVVCAQEHNDFSGGSP